MEEFVFTGDTAEQGNVMAFDGAPVVASGFQSLTSFEKIMVDVDLAGNSTSAEAGADTSYLSLAMVTPRLLRAGTHGVMYEWNAPFASAPVLRVMRVLKLCSRIQ